MNSIPENHDDYDEASKTTVSREVIFFSLVDKFHNLILSFANPDVYSVH